MKKRYYNLYVVILLAVILSACGNSADPSKPGNLQPKEETQNLEISEKESEDTSEEIQKNSLEEETETSAEENAENSENTEGVEMQEIMIRVGGQQFHAVLYENETVKAWKTQLPMTIDMEELHGNEKYYYLKEELPTNSEKVGRIQPGDIMLFGSDCLVLFYEDFHTSYSYTRIGHIQEAEAFAGVLPKGAVEVTFEAEE